MAIRQDASGESLSRTANLPSITSFTMMGWFKIVTNRSTDTQFMTFGHATLDQLVQVGLPSSGALTLSLYCTNGGVDSGSSLSLNTWYHIAVTRSGTGAGQTLVYLNGVQNISNALLTTIPVAQKFYIGANSFNEWLNGCYAGIQIYNVALTVSQIAQQVSWHRPLLPTNLIGWYPCVNDVVANNALDLSGGGNTMTVGGTLAVEQGPPIGWSPRWQRYARVETGGTSNPLSLSGSLTGSGSLVRRVNKPFAGVI